MQTQSRAHLEVTFSDTNMLEFERVVLLGCDKKIGIRAMAGWDIDEEQRTGMPIFGQKITVTGANHGSIEPSLLTSRGYKSTGRLGGWAGAAEFTYVPKSVGHDILIFSADLPISPQSRTTTHREYAIDIEVKSCTVSVNMIYDMNWPIQGAVFRGIGIMDEVTLEADDEGNLRGVGTMIYNQTVTGLPICEVSWDGWSSEVTITGQMEDDQVGLNFAFGDATVTSSASCPLPWGGSMGGTGSSTGNPSVGFASSLTFPSQGGVIVYPSPGGVPATVTVIVTTDEEEEVVSDAGVPIIGALDWWSHSWLSGWLGQSE